MIFVGEESCTLNHVWTTMDSNTSKYKLMVGERTTTDDDTTVNMIISPTTDDASSPPAKFSNLILGAYTRLQACPEEIMRITTSGVGIKTSSPSYTLDVAGDIRVTDDLFVDDFARIDALRVGTTATDPGDGNLFVEGTTQINTIAAAGASYSGDKYWIVTGKQINHQ